MVINSMVLAERQSNLSSSKDYIINTRNATNEQFLSPG
jgi:hypothetical protein